MSARTPTDIPISAISDPKTAKKKKKKSGKSKTNSANAEQVQTPGTKSQVREDEEDATKVLAVESEESEPEDSETKPAGPSTETSVEDDPISSLTNGLGNTRIADASKDAGARFDALFKDRDALRAEVTQLRKSLEELRATHQTEVEGLQEQLQEAHGEKEQAEEQYQNLLAKVNTIRSQLGERLKADAEELSQARTRIEELGEQKASLQEQYTVRSAEVETLTAEVQAQSKELSSLRNRANLSQQNWIKERDELLEQESFLREEFENAKQAMHDWEVLAMEERSVRRDLSDKVGDLEERLASLNEAYERAASERDTQSTTVDGLQKALQEIQSARKKELRELVESSQNEVESLRRQLQDAEKASAAAATELETTKKELERALPFEKEVKEKNLLIGKLRHEAVTLNDHLTKALRFLKKGKPEDNVDRQIVTNHLLHFVTLDRSDPKKFQILQLIAALLGWTEEQREQAGLARPGAATGTATTGGGGSLRMAGSPLMHRTPSSPALANEYFQDNMTASPATKESLAELWQNFLEQEAQGGSGGGAAAGVAKGKGKDRRRPSTAEPSKPS